MKKNILKLLFSSHRTFFTVAKGKNPEGQLSGLSGSVTLEFRVDLICQCSGKGDSCSCNRVLKDKGCEMH